MGTERALIEVFEIGEKSCCLAIEPPSAVKSLKEHLQNQPNEVAVGASELVGDLQVELLNGKSLEQIIGNSAIVVARHTA